MSLFGESTKNDKVHVSIYSGHQEQIQREIENIPEKSGKVAYFRSAKSTDKGLNKKCPKFYLRII